MIISPKLIINREIVTSTNKKFSENQFQPNGIDVRVDTIQRIGSLSPVLSCPSALSQSSFKITKEDFKDKISLEDLKVTKNVFNLKKFHPYCVECFESVVVPDNMVAMIYGRSTLNRNGIFIRSSIYDSGFICEKIGFTLYPWNDCQIERGSRIAQIIFVEASSDFQYNGQYQGMF